MISRVNTEKLPADVVAILQSFEKVKKRKDVKDIAKATGFTPEYVSEVLRGNYLNDEVVEKAFDLTLERTSKWSSRLERLKQLQ
jgi:hypothetical protein